MTGLTWLAVFCLGVPLALLGIGVFAVVWTWLEPRVDAWLDR